MKIPSLTSTTIMSALDNERSLWPLLVKDLIDNGGRSYMEYNRGGQGAHHAGRERAFEEFATTAVWIGGRKALDRWVFNPLMRHIGLDPEVDISLFMKKPLQAIPSWIAKNRNRYLQANIAKFILGTLIPVGIIGLAIPTINQYITYNKLLEEYKQTPQPRHCNTLPPKPDLFQWLDKVTGKPNYPGVRFGGFLDKAARWINDDVYANIAIDAGISGGRLYKARNWVDRTETLVRESSIVIFLYFMGDYVKGKLRNFFDNRFKTVTELTYNSLSWLKKSAMSVPRWQQEISQVSALTPQNAMAFLSKSLNPNTGRFDGNNVLELARRQGLIHVAAPGSLPGIKTHTIDPRKFLSLDTLKSSLVGTPKAPGIAKQLISGLTPGNISKSFAGKLATTGKYKTIAMLSSYAVSTVSIAFLTPLFQHWLTQQLTGQKDFPGIKQYMK